MKWYAVLVILVLGGLLMAHGRPDFSPTAVDVVLRPEWAAEESTDKSFSGTGVNLSWGNSATLSYTVPAGKKLYITGWSVAARPAVDPGAIVQVLVYGLIANLTDGSYYGYIGGEGGGGVSFNKPVVIDSEEIAYFQVRAFGSVNLTLGFAAWGYER